MNLPILLLLLVVVTAALVGWHLYLWMRLVRDTTSDPKLHKVGLALFLALAVLIPVTSVLSRQTATQSWRALYYVGYGWLGLGMLITVVLAAIDLSRLIHRAIRKLAGNDSTPPDPGRRQTLARMGAGAAVVMGMGESAVGLDGAFGPWEISQWRVALEGFPEKLEGLRLVHITDIHVGATRGSRYLPSLVAKVNALKPDVVAITGDLVDGSVKDLGHRIEALRDLNPRFGVYFVTGNHEYYSGAEDWVLFLEHLGIEVLANRTARVGLQDANFDLVGVNDWTAERFNPREAHDLPRALAGTDSSRTQVLLAHQPVSAWQASEHRIDLQLSGHTHGGQIFPWNYVVLLQQPYVKGMHRLRDTLVYVNRGAGFWGPPMRVGAPPEIALFILERARRGRSTAVKERHTVS